MLSFGDDHAVLLLGGFRAPGPVNATTVAPDPAWVFELGVGWSDLGHGELPPLQDAVYDSGSDLVVILTPNNPQIAPDLRGPTTFTYEPSSGVIRQMGPGGPDGLIGTRAAYDAESDRIIAFGGWDLGPAESSQTWAYDADTDMWTEMNPGVSPPGRNFHEMVYDPTSDRVILFGGGTGSASLRDTWAYDYNSDTWTALATEGPTPRSYSSMTYDPARHRLILFGGVTGLSEEPLGDTWEFDLESNTWTELDPDNPPSPRGWHAMAYDSDRDVVVMFGGGTRREAYTTETWIYDPADDSWRQAP